MRDNAGVGEGKMPFDAAPAVCPGWAHARARPHPRAFPDSNEKNPRIESIRGPTTLLQTGGVVTQP
jgi:hypothetical protein